MHRAIHRFDSCSRVTCPALRRWTWLSHNAFVFGDEVRCSMPRPLTLSLSVPTDVPGAGAHTTQPIADVWLAHVKNAHPHRVRNRFDCQQQNLGPKSPAKIAAAKLAWPEPSRSRRSIPLPGDLYSVGGTHGMPFEKSWFLCQDL